MVLTNFECWANGGAANIDGDFPFAGSAGTRHVDPFNPRALENFGLNAAIPAVSYISFNGYYGFSYVNRAEPEENTNESNNNNSIVNNNNICHTNNNVNQNNHSNSNEYVNGNNDNRHVNTFNNNHTTNTVLNSANTGRCKKRAFVSDDGCFIPGMDNACVNGTNASKRCRFDDDFAAQYCNDFFALPATQIGTQSCLMDTEDFVNGQQQQQHQQQHHQPETLQQDSQQQQHQPQTVLGVISLPFPLQQQTP